MKVTDYNVIAECADARVDDLCPDLVEIIGRDSAVWCVMGIYLSNDVTSGYGQDFEVNPDIFNESGFCKCSVISSKERISVILDSQMSYYKDRYSICGYEDLVVDVANICIYIQTAISRILFRS